MRKSISLVVSFFLPVLADYLKTGLVLRFPTLITCGFVAIAALQSLFSGLILHTMRQKDRQDFESKLIRIHEDYQRKLKEDSHESET